MTAHPIDTEELRRDARRVISDPYGGVLKTWWASHALRALDALEAAEHRADEAEKVHRDLTSSLGFGDGITEPMADNKTIIQHVGGAVTDAQELWELTQAACVEAGCDPEEDCYDHHPVRRAERAEHRATRAEAQSETRRASILYWQEQAGAMKGSARALAHDAEAAQERAQEAESRIAAALAVLDEDTRWQNDTHLLARVREALTG